eukprot:g1773.t1
MAWCVPEATDESQVVDDSDDSDESQVIDDSNDSDESQVVDDSDGSDESEPELQQRQSTNGPSGTRYRAFNTGLVTGPQQYIGGSSEYHIDTKFKDGLPMEQVVSMVDSMAVAYANQGRVIEFSNSAVAGEKYDPNASDSQKESLLRRVFGAHAHRSGWKSMDYYIPLKSEPRGRFGPSAEGAEIIAPVIAGGTLEFHKETHGYGAYVSIIDENGVYIAKTGHGDLRKAKSGTVQT